MSRAVAVVLVLLAGCTDPGEPGRPPASAECLEQGLVLNQTAQACQEPPFEVRDFEDPAHFCVVNQHRDRVHAPDLVGDPWVLGQYWTYSLRVDGEDHGPTQLIYYGDQDLDSAGTAQHYMVGTPTRDEALLSAVHSVNPMLGRIHRVLYSPHESGDHADMFHFPLCEGSSWQTVFYGEQFTLEASKAGLSLPDGMDRGFVIAGTSASGSRLELSYSPQAQWFTYIDLERADGGGVQMELIETGTGYSGPAHFLRGQKDEAIAINGSTALPTLAGTVEEVTFERADGSDGAYDTIGLGIEAHVTGAGLAVLEILDPAGEVAWNRTLGGGEPDRVDTLAEVPYAAGTWTVRLRGVAVDPAGSMGAQVQVVSIYDRSGSA